MVRHYTDKPMPDNDEWIMPPLDTLMVCDGVEMTLGEMLDGIDPDFVPQTKDDYEWFLFCMGEGIKETLAEQKARDEAWERHFILVK